MPNVSQYGRLLAGLAAGLFLLACTKAPHDVIYMPVIDSQWWRIGNNPDLGELMPAKDQRKPEVVDHGFIRAQNGAWQLWACIRNTGVGRILYGWEGKSLEEESWTPKGIMMRAEKQYGEPVDPEQIGAPYFKFIDGTYHLFYHSISICMATSPDGIHYTKKINKSGNPSLFPSGGRDAMVIKIGNTYFCYSTVTTVSGDGFRSCFITVRTSDDLENWSDYTIVSEGGVAGNGAVSAECPHVVEMDGYFYLFRTQKYVPAITHVYRSDNPYNFGVNDDSKRIGVIEAAAPEIINHEGVWYISSTADYQGVMLAKLRWDRIG